MKTQTVVLNELEVALLAGACHEHAKRLLQDGIEYGDIAAKGRAAAEMAERSTVWWGLHKTMTTPEAKT